ncbi:Hypothetical predicted protein [Mytilus galloprovincialis]|uniref:C-type lectin domain-containing protein n=1 Tax=Mytilus galloprovincialis TaxID=29158 RepID=A0A8B6CSE4_MYTGA|nr:Hypothetical predicted protein [Mytilus galloprovincialis]
MDVLHNFVLFFLHIQYVVCLLLRTGVGLKNTEFTDFKITEQHLNAVVRPCLISCSVLCFENTNCLSFSYNRKTQECQLWEDDFIDIGITRSSPDVGWRYYYIIRECRIAREICQLNSGFSYIPGVCFCYRYESTKLLYQDSVDMCASYNSYLAKVDRGLVQLTLEQILASVIDGEVRIQGVLNSGAATWRYDNNDLITYFNWNKQNGQPSLNANEKYLLIRKSRDYRWHDIYTYEKYGVVCHIT